MKKNIFITFLIINNILFAVPKMLPVKSDSLNILMSETLVTVEDYKEYLYDTGSLSDVQLFEHSMTRVIDCWDYKIKEEFPAWSMNWMEAAEYCNWLSRKNNLKPCYEFTVNRYGVTVVDINRDASGFRMPYVRELLIVSGLKDGLSKNQYESENTHGIKNDPNYWNILSVFEGKKNQYGIYDVLGNIEQFCNDYYLEGYDYFDYSLPLYGPDEWTPDLDVLFYQDCSTRCSFGGYFYSKYEDFFNKKIDSIYAQDGWNIFGIRLIRELNY